MVKKFLGRDSYGYEKMKDIIISKKFDIAIVILYNAQLT